MKFQDKLKCRAPYSWKIRQSAGYTCLPNRSLFVTHRTIGSTGDFKFLEDLITAQDGEGVYVLTGTSTPISNQNIEQDFHVGYEKTEFHLTNLGNTPLEAKIIKYNPRFDQERTGFTEVFKDPWTETPNQYTLTIPYLQDEAQELMDLYSGFLLSNDGSAFATHANLVSDENICMFPLGSTNWSAQRGTGNSSLTRSGVIQAVQSYTHHSVFDSQFFTHKYRVKGIKKVVLMPGQSVKVRMFKKWNKIFKYDHAIVSNLKNVVPRGCDKLMLQVSGVRGRVRGVTEAVDSNLTGGTSITGPTISTAGALFSIDCVKTVKGYQLHPYKRIDVISVDTDDMNTTRSLGAVAVPGRNFGIEVPDAGPDEVIVVNETADAIPVEVQP